MIFKRPGFRPTVFNPTASSHGQAPTSAWQATIIDDIFSALFLISGEAKYESLILILVSFDVGVSANSDIGPTCTSSSNCIEFPPPSTRVGDRMVEARKLPTRSGSLKVTEPIYNLHVSLEVLYNNTTYMLLTEETRETWVHMDNQVFYSRLYNVIRWTFLLQSATNMS